MDKLWEIRKPDPADVRRIADGVGVDPVLACLLVNRGIREVSEAEAFLSPGLDQLRPPFSLKDASKAAARIAQALLKHEKILIFGDYDVDGVTGALVVYDFLKPLHREVSVYLPHRVKEGYGFKVEHVARHIAPGKYDLVITVDCGSGSREAVKAASQAGIDVIVTDHHKIDPPLPEAVAVVNPNRPDCPSGFGHLAGVGVAYYLVIVLRRHLRETGFWESRPEPNLREFCDLVALGTVADMAPLIRENRILVREGLGLIQSGRRAAVRALSEASGIGLESVDAMDIAFRLSPRINAAGRVDHAGLAFDLLQEQNLDAARRKAARLSEMNTHRQRLEKQILDDIDRRLAERPEMLKKRTWVLWDPGWHEGVLGIVASKVVEKYRRMAVLMSTKNGVGKGSARGVPGLDLYRFLNLCSGLLEDFGGHEAAAGLKIRQEQIEAFSQAFEEVVCRETGPEDFIPKVVVDGELSFDRITADFVDALERLAPHGAANPAPLFLARNVRVVSHKEVGTFHRKLRLAQSENGPNPAVEAIQFNVDPGAPLKTAFSRIAYRLSWNRWQGRKTLQVVVEEAD